MTKILSEYIYRDAGLQGGMECGFPSAVTISRDFKHIRTIFSSFIEILPNADRLYVICCLQDILTAIHDTTRIEIKNVISDELRRNNPEIGLNASEKDYYVKYSETLKKYIDIHFPIKPLDDDSYELYQSMIIRKTIKARFNQHSTIISLNEDEEKRLLGEITRNMILPVFQERYSQYINGCDRKPATVQTFNNWIIKNSGDIAKKSYVPTKSITVGSEFFDSFFKLNWACQFSWPPAELSGIGSNFSIKSLPRRLDPTDKNPYGLIVVEENDVHFLNIEDVNKPKYLKYHEVELSVLFPQLVFLSLDKPPVVVNEGYVLWRMGSNKQLQQESASSATAAVPAPAPADVHGKEISIEAEIEEDTTSDSDSKKVQEDLSPDVKIEIKKALRKLDLVLGDLLLNYYSNDNLKSLIQELKTDTKNFICQIDKNAVTTYKQNCIKLHDRYNNLLETIRQSDELINDTIWGAIYQTLRYLFDILDIGITRPLSLKSMEKTYTPGAPTLLDRNHFFGSSTSSAVESFSESLKVLEQPTNFSAS